ncbi:hypothetical protein GCM10027347_44790 [Larkinella harenae]
MSELLRSVGLSGVTPENQPAKVYVNALPGMSTELAAAVTKGADTVTQLWAKVQSVALERLTTCLEIELQKQASFRHIVCSTEQPRPAVSALPVLPVARYLGNAIAAPYSGRHAAIRVNTVEFLSQSSGNSTLKVYDLMGRSELFSQAVAINEGYNAIAVNKSFSVNWRGLDLFIGIDISATTLLELELSCAPDELTIESGMLPLAGLKARSSLIESPAAVYVDASLTCDILSVADRFVDKLCWPFAYYCAVLLLDEKIASPKFNLFTQTNRMDTEDRIVQYKDEARKRVSQAAKLIFQQLNGSVCLCANEQDQPGFYSGSFV